MQVHVNGQRVFAQGGWLQPEMLFDMPAARIEAEVRYLAEANLHTVTFEDVPVPSDAFLEACDRYGLMYWCCFYGSFWIQPGRTTPEDRNLLNRCGADIIKRHRNHPSLVLYSCCGESEPAEDIYLPWRKDVRELDGTRLFIPTIDVHEPLEWLRQDLPTGVRDDRTFQWVRPGRVLRKGAGRRNMDVQYGGFHWLAAAGGQPEALPAGAVRKENGFRDVSAGRAWAHHGANNYYKAYDAAIRRLYGEPESAVDYCMKASLVSANQHRAWSEAVNHRLWEVTSGVWQWKINSCWPDVNWQIYDWYLRPMPSAYYYRLAFEPLHVQLSPLDSMVTVINRRTTAEKGLTADIAVYDSQSKLRWQKSAPRKRPPKRITMCWLSRQSTV